jgi:hypothetical protein
MDLGPLRHDIGLEKTMDRELITSSTDDFWTQVVS